ncbi:hypothetical protein TNCV_3013401 [Trichonephila clavipes]|nr:hypothetical protein TNCV_3013401 [Trichonephila clavipes]
MLSLSIIIPTLHIEMNIEEWFIKFDARETRRIGICRSAGTRPCLHHLSGTQHETGVCLVLQRQLVPRKTLVDNFKRSILEAKHMNEFRPDDVLREKVSKGLLRNPDRLLKNTN